MALPYKPYFYIATRKVSVVRRVRSHDLSLMLWGALELNLKGPLEKWVRKTDFTVESPFTLISI